MFKDQYGVMGHPIRHSKSPVIHTRFAAQTGQSLVYRAMHVLPGELARAIAAFQTEGGKGLSITLPFKEEAMELVDTLTARAKRANAVNTIRFDDMGKRHGDNTDGIGLIRDLKENQRISVAKQRVLLLGAGGAVRGVVGPLLDEGPLDLIIANRTPEKARALAEQFVSDGPVRGCGLNELDDANCDLVINATSSSLSGEIPAIGDTVLRPRGCCYDLMYDVSGPTAFVRWGRQHGAAQSVDGLGMLVEQAAEAFYRWRGIRPHTSPVIATLRNLP
uniref:Shikimate dehydrogenase (NADP(+)) n=1 Tax=Candidatus Kentrum sp. MB TaxID=2138164 RepID=A0A450XKF8_9GAMM|nr:MAG: shikimate dehydrogenase [Candidatus Kentron sp. MB]VFK29709.1 MAG: shikimate dehydrogenase [Candidatus Kentron sp. MB]VFK74878.1 MAG: shikimate dehydrogenase [Candidatus Kentron sp. MB]